MAPNKLTWAHYEDPPPIPTYGDPKGALIEVEVIEIDGELDRLVTCNCAACYTIQMIGLPEEELTEVGVYYMTVEHEETFHYEYGTEHDVYLVLNEVGKEDTE